MMLARQVGCEARAAPPGQAPRTGADEPAPGWHPAATAHGAG